MLRFRLKAKSTFFLFFSNLFFFVLVADFFRAENRYGNHSPAESTRRMWPSSVITNVSVMKYDAFEFLLENFFFHFSHLFPF